MPFGALERDGEVVIHESSLSVIGCAEAAANADLVTLPSGRSCLSLPLELIAVLKLIAFAGRQPAQTKDADDLLTVLRASSEGVYGDETWEDELALAATEFAHQLAGASRLGRRGIACFNPDRARRVLDLAAQIQPAVRLALRGPTTNSSRHGSPDSVQAGDGWRPGNVRLTSARARSATNGQGRRDRAPEGPTCVGPWRVK